MLHRIRSQIGTAGLIVAIVALVAALAGGAIAANGGGDATTSKTKKVKGPRGPKGAKGDTGAAGAQGPAGANGKDGANGQNGAPGQDGASGNSVVVNPADEITECPDVGGVIVEVETEPSTAEEVCNGEEGPAGEEGSPWTAGGTLPPGATETGGWAFNAVQASDTEGVWTSISFPIPLAQPITETHVHYVEAPTTECPGGVENPTAKPGELCVYKGIADAEPPLIARLGGFELGASQSGALLIFGTITEAVATGVGSWAVTGCSPTLPVGDPNRCPA